MSPSLDPEESKLIAQIADAWRSATACSPASLQEVHGEVPESVYELFLGKAPSEIDREEAIDIGFPLHWMTPDAVATYLCIYMIKIIENMPLKRAAYFLLDHALIPHLFNQLTQDTFITSTSKHLTRPQLYAVEAFITYALQNASLLKLEESEITALHTTSDSIQSMLKAAKPKS